MDKVSFSSSHLGSHLIVAKHGIRLHTKQQSGYVDIQEESWGKSDPWDDSVINLYQVDGPTMPSEPRMVETFFPSALPKLVPVNSTLQLSTQKCYSSKIDGEILAQSVLAILSGNRKNDEISGELVELLGLDQIHLVSEILDNRRLAIRQVRYVLHSYG